jgi:hypothetical protein
MGKLVFILSKSQNMHQQPKQSVGNSMCQDNNHNSSYMQIRAAYLLQILREIFKSIYCTVVQSVTTLKLPRHGQCMWNLQWIKWQWDRISPSTLVFLRQYQPAHNSDSYFIHQPLKTLQFQPMTASLNQTHTSMA